MKDKKRKSEILLVAGILVIACALYAVNLFVFSKPAAYVEVTVDGEVVETLDLNQDTQITIHSYNEGTNHLIIQGGEVWIDEASCPDAICIHQGKIHKNGEMIVCLPNLMIAKIVSDDSQS